MDLKMVTHLQLDSNIEQREQQINSENNNFLTFLLFTGCRFFLF